MKPFFKATVLSACLLLGSTSLRAQSQDSTQIDTATMNRMVQLQGATVKAQKRLVKMESDKVTYSVKDDPDSKHATLLDMMRRIPLVTVDGQDKVQVKGSENYKVYVDGKPSPIFQNNPSQVMKMIPANTVKNVEVITNPGAKYDAEGTVIINITMNAGSQGSMDGIYGTARLEGGNQTDNASLGLGGQQGKLNFNSNFGAYYLYFHSLSVNTDRKSWDADGNETLFSSHNTFRSKAPNFMGNFHLGYDIDSLNIANAGLGFATAQQWNHGTTANTLGALAYSEEMRYKSRSTTLSANADFRHYFNRAAGHSITFSYLFSMTPGHDYSKNIPLDNPSIVERDNDNHNRTLEHTGQVDYVLPLTAKQSLSLGTKYTNRLNKSEAEYSTSDDTRYRDRNNILAAYGEYEGTFGKWKTKEGVRFEQTWEKMEISGGTRLNSNFTNFVPSANLSCTLSATQSIGLTHGMRISRPGISYLNPYRDESETGTVIYGNPNLDVEKSHQIGLVYNFFSPKVVFNANLSHDFSNNQIEQYSFTEDDVLNSTFGNIRKSHDTQLSLFATVALAQNSKLILRGAAEYVDLRSNRINARNSGWQWGGMAGLQQRLPWKLDLSAFVFGNTKRYTLQGWSSGMPATMISLSRGFIGDKLNVTMQGITPLSHGGHLVFKSYSHSADFENTMTLRAPLVRFNLSVTYNFGSTKVKRSSHESSIKSDLIQHSKGGMDGIGGNSSK